MTFDHLEHVITVSRKFEDYMIEVNDGVTDEEWARDNKQR
jgi:hypothetical protein